MRSSYFHVGLITSMLAAAISFVIMLPMRAVGWVLDRIPFLADPRALTDLFGRPALALDGPADCLIAPSLANDQRHEAGLARLGTVRHR